MPTADGLPTTLEVAIIGMVQTAANAGCRPSDLKVTLVNMEPLGIELTLGGRKHRTGVILVFDEDGEPVEQPDPSNK